MRGKSIAIPVTLLLAITGSAASQDDRPASPRGQAAIQVGGEWVEQEGRTRYVDGKWVEIDYGRPILRGREEIFGEGEEYGKQVSGGGDLWRAGANQTTRLHTEAALTFGETTVAPGEYSFFIDLDEEGWTLVISSQPYQEEYDPEAKETTWGAVNYDPQFDVVRVPMRMKDFPNTIEQFTIAFLDVTPTGGTIAFGWEKTVGLADFKLGA